MFPRLSNRIVDVLVENKTINSENRELYYYGFNQGLTAILNLFTVLLIGIIFGCTVQLAVFMVAYIPLRSYAGGFHASTHIRCYILSIIILCVIALILNIDIISMALFYCVGTLSVLAIILLCPVEDKNKPLDQLESKVYKKRTIIIMLIEILFGGLFLIIGLYKMHVCLCLCWITVGILLVGGMIKNAILNR